MLLHPGGAKAFCCNLSCRESALLHLSVNAAWMCTLSSVSFVLEAIDDPKNVTGNMDLPMGGLRQHVL
jgi:hypothetical protein